MIKHQVQGVNGLIYDNANGCFNIVLKVKQILFNVNFKNDRH